MKKLFLTASLILAMAGIASAQNFADCFTVSYKGTQLNDGDHVVVDTSNPGGFYETAIDVYATADEPKMATFTMAAFEPSFQTINDDYEGYGIPGLCYTPYVDNEPVGGNCWPGGAEDFGTGRCRIESVSNSGRVELQVHTGGNLPATYRLLMRLLDEDEDPTGEVFSIYVDMNSGVNGIEGINADNVPAEYFDLQGRRVANPVNGLYIVKRGEKVVKSFIR